MATKNTKQSVEPITEQKTELNDQVDGASLNLEDAIADELLNDMRWQKVESLAAEHGLALYRPLCGYHKLVQITDTNGNPVSWTSNKARSAMKSLEAIIKQRELSALSNEQAIADGIAAKELII